MSDWAYYASEACPDIRRPCECKRPIGKQGRTFPHRRTPDCERFELRQDMDKAARQSERVWPYNREHA